MSWTRPKPGRALLADDDEPLRILLGKILTLYGFDVTHAVDGYQALEVYGDARGQFDLLVTDICMPNVNGRDLIRAVRAWDARLPIIAITGFCSPELLRDVESCNAVLFEKPIDFHRLHAYIDSIHPYRRALAGREEQ